MPVPLALPLVALDAGRLHVLASDGILPREALAPLRDAQQLLDAAQDQANQVRDEALRDAAALRTRAQADGVAWLREREQELQAQLVLQQGAWLATLESAWTAALEACLRELCGGVLKAEVMAGALEAGLQHFETMAGIRIGVHPDTVDAVRAALPAVRGLQQGGAALLRIDPDPAVAPGRCRLRSAQLEVTLDLDRAIELALGRP